MPTVLARINHDYGNRFIIIIDEWDFIFREDKLDTAAQEAYLTLLIHLGYLAYDSKTKEVYIPHEEIRSEFRNAIEGAGWDSSAEGAVSQIKEKTIQQL